MNSQLLSSANYKTNHSGLLWRWLMAGNFSWLLLFHIIIGLTAVISSIPVVLWVYTLLLIFLFSNTASKHKILPYLLLYLIPIEVFGRMVNTSPFLPWELNKYLGIFLLMYGILTNRSKSKGLVGMLMLVLLIPGFMIGILKSESILRELSFNGFGMINLCLAIIYFANKTIDQGEMAGIFRILILGASMVLIYIIVLSPSLDDVSFNLGANFDLTGGFGSNQVSTILGLAGGVGILLWLLQIRLTRFALLNFIIPSLFLAWALLSFSRGGVLAPVFALVLVVVFARGGRGTFSVRKVNFPLIMGLIAMIPVLFYFLNKITGNQLLLRYLGETNKTVAGESEKSLNAITTGRWEVFVSDIEIWSDHFLFGTGVGQSATIRENYGLENVAAHVEISRLLSEHGLLGLAATLLFLLIPIYAYLSSRSSLMKALLLFSFAVAILTSMHSAMRTFVTPIFYGLAFVQIRES